LRQGEGAIAARLERILYVEDEPDIQTIVRLSLENLGGFTVKICSSGSDALAEAAAFAPHFIMLDAMMPGMDGPSVLGALRAIPSLIDIPVVFVTAKAMPSEVERFKQLGAVDVIPKPFDPMTLPQRIRTIWERCHG
jgi:CheY-like chemotaxis protein